MLFYDIDFLVPYLWLFEPSELSRFENCKINKFKQVESCNVLVEFLITPL